MVKKTINPAVKKDKPAPVSTKAPAKPKSHKTSGWRSRRLKDAYFAVWTVVGIMLIVAAAVAVLGSGTWVENLNLAETGRSSAPAAQQQPQQPPQPSQEELDCVIDGVGEERFTELQQGDAPDAAENAVIEECLEF